MKKSNEYCEKTQTIVILTTSCFNGVTFQSKLRLSFEESSEPFQLVRRKNERKFCKQNEAKRPENFVGHQLLISTCEKKQPMGEMMGERFKKKENPQGDLWY